MINFDDANGQIVATDISLPLNCKHTSYEWTGNDLTLIDGPVFENWLSADDMKAGHVFNIGPIRLRIVEIYWQMDQILCIRDGWRSTLRYRLHRSLFRFDDVYRRLIITMHIWGLANLPLDTYRRYPSWCDIKIIKRFQKWQRRQRP
jgi:hypothetical protein